jgi:hypothetical protein
MSLMPVYFIQIGIDGPVKIGRTRNPKQRLEALQTGHYETLALIRVIDGGKEEELWFHREFQDFHIRNEWFKFHDNMMVLVPTNIIKKVKSGLPGRPGPKPNGKAMTGAERQRRHRLKKARLIIQTTTSESTTEPECKPYE